MWAIGSLVSVGDKGNKRTIVRLFLEGDEHDTETTMQRSTSFLFLDDLVQFLHMEDRSSQTSCVAQPSSDTVGASRFDDDGAPHATVATRFGARGEVVAIVGQRMQGKENGLDTL